MNHKDVDSFKESTNEIFTRFSSKNMEEKLLEEVDQFILERFGEVQENSRWLFRFYGLMTPKFVQEMITASKERLRSLLERLGKSSVTLQMRETHENSLESIETLLENRKPLFRENHPHEIALSLLAASHCQGRALDMSSSPSPAVVHVAISIALSLYKVAVVARERLPQGGRDPLLDFMVFRVGEIQASTGTGSLERIREF